ncbi:unnamed protein product [Closterium sp. NIES-53]
MGLLSAALAWSWTSLYAAHQLNLQPRVSLPETSPTLRWTGKVGDASAFRVWGSWAFVRDLSADKLSPRAVPCVFLGFPPDAPVPYYRLFPYRSTPLPPPPLFLAPGPPPVDPLPPQGPAPSSVSQVDAVKLVEVAVDSGAARGAEPAGAGSRGAEPEGAEPGGAESRGAEPRGAEPGGAESGGAEPGGAESGGAESGGAEPEGAEPGGAEPGGAGLLVRSAGAGGTSDAAGPGDTAGATGGTGAAGTSGAAGAPGVGPAGGTAGTTGGTGAAGPPGTGAAGATGAGAAGSVGASGSAGAGASEGAGVGTVGARGATGAGAAAGVTGAVPTESGGAARLRPYFAPLLEQVLGLPPSPGPAPPLACPLPVHSQSPLRPASPLPAPSPYTGPTRGLAEHREPASRPASPVRAACTSRRAPRPRPPAVPGTHQMPLRPSTAPLHVPLPSPPESSLPVLADPESDSLRAASPTVTRLLATVVTDPSFESTAASALVTELVDFAARCRLDYAISLVADVLLMLYFISCPRYLLRELFARRWSRAARAGGTLVGAAARVTGSGGASRPRPYFVPLLEQVLGLPPSTGPAPPLAYPQRVQSQSQLRPASPLPAPSPYTGPTGGLAERHEPMSRPALPVRAARTSSRAPRPRPPAVPGTHKMALRPSTAPLRVPLPSPPAFSLPVLADPESDSLRAASPTVTRLLATIVTDPSFESTAASALVAELVDFAARCLLDYATSLVAESESVCPPSVGGECALSTDVLEDRQEEFQCFAAALPPLVSTLLAPEGDPDAPDIPTPRSYAEAIEGPYSSQWQAAMDIEMASWKSTRTYVDEVPPPGANIVSGMWIFRVKRPPGSPPVFKARYVARGFSQRQGVDYFQTFSPTPKMTTLRVLLHVAAQRDYELHSLDFSTAFLQGSLHEEIWLRRPPGFTVSFPPGAQWSLRRPVYGLRQAPREWHDTLRTTLAALGFAPSTADPSLFLRTDTPLPPFYILVYVDDLVFATADTAGLAHVKSELQKRHTCTDLGELRSYLGLQMTRDRAQRTITLTQSHMVQQVLQRFDFTYSSPQATPLSTRHSLSALPSDESVEPSGPYPELVGCLMYLMTCTRPDLAYPLSILARYVAPGRHRPEHMAAAKRVLRYLCNASWVDDLATKRSSQGYTFSLGSGSVLWRSTRSSSVLSSSCEAEIYVGAMAAQLLRWLTYLLTDLGEPPRSLPQCGHLRLAYVASQANTADIFTKALQPCDHQRFCTMLACFALLCFA